MKKDLQQIDRIFEEAHQKVEIQPSHELWDKIAADLDKKDREFYKEKYRYWKKVAVIIPLMVSSLWLYEARVEYRSDFNTILSDQKSFNSNNGSQANFINTEKLSKQLAVPVQSVEHPVEIERNEWVQHSSHPDTHNPNIEMERDQSLLSSLQVSDDALVTSAKNWQLEKAGREADFSHPFVPPAFNLSTSNLIGTVADRYHVNSAWSVSPFFSGDLAQYHLDNELELPGHDDEKTEILNREHHEFSYSAGLMLEKEVMKNVRIKTGLHYSKTNILIAPQELYASIENNEVKFKYIASSGYEYLNPIDGTTTLPGDSIMSTEAQHSLESISLPLMASYEIKKRKFSILPSAGIFVSWLTKAKLTTEITQWNKKEAIYVNKLRGMKDLYLGFIADIQLDYKINRRISLRVAPNVKYAMTFITSNNVVKTFPYSVGLSGGINVRL